MKPRLIVIFDLDGTCCDTEHRKHFVQGKSRNFTAFNLACVYDTPLPTLDIFRLLANNQEVDTYLFSGRDGKVREQTLDWLVKETGFLKSSLNAILWMRKPGCNRPDQVIKKEFFEALKGQYEAREQPYKVIGVFDDRNKVIRMWQENGLFVFNCNQTGEEF